VRRHQEERQQAAGAGQAGGSVPRGPHEQALAQQHAEALEEDRGVAGVAQVVHVLRQGSGVDKKQG
jgi:hypothetical protein